MKKHEFHMVKRQGYDIINILDWARKYVCYHIIERVIFYVYPTGAGRTNDK